MNASQGLQQAPQAGLVDAAPGRMRQAIDWIGMVSAGGIVVVVLAQVVGRLLGRPFPWTEELTRACFIWMVFMGMAAGMRHADSARVTVLLEYLPRPLRSVALPCYVLFSLGFFALMAWTGFTMVKQQFNMNETIATLGWPSWVIGIVVPLSAVIAMAGTWASLREHRTAIALTGSESTK